MNIAKNVALLAISLVVATGCAPDLIVRDLDVTWDSVNKRATAEIANVGNEDAGSFLVYFNGEEDPVSQNHRPQVSHSVPALAAGDSTILEADFAPLAHPDNNNLGNVLKVLVLVDPKNMVEESNENNNEKWKQVAGVAVLAYRSSFYMTVDGGYVYWSVNRGEFCTPPGALLRMRSDGGAVESLYSDCDFSPAEVEADSQWVYAVDWESDNIVKVPITGGNPVIVANANGAIYHRGLAVDDTYVYWADEDGIKRAAKDGTSTITLSSDSRVHDLAVDATHVYWTTGPINNGEIRRLPKNGGSMQVLAGGGLHYPRAITSDASHVYWAEITALKRVDLSGAASPTGIYSESGSQMSSVAVSGNFLYWSQTDSGGLLGTGKVRRVPVVGGAVTDIETGLSGPGSLRTDGQYLYWNDKDGIRRAPLMP